MREKAQANDVSRRTLLAAAGIAGAVFVAPPCARASDDDLGLIRTLTGTTPIESDRVHLAMPTTFPNAYTVPLTLMIDSPMTEGDHVRRARVLAPQNPIIEVASFNFVPMRSEPHVSTRIRLAKSQYVLAVAEMSDGTLLMAKSWVKVDSNGCD
ncbi:MAG: thiosulfate oxidation carrier protein SoxY [Gammaproteobacteria bacterium]